MLKNILVSIVIGVLLFLSSAINDETQAQTQNGTLPDSQQSNEHNQIGTATPRVMLPGENRHQIKNTRTSHYQSIGYIEKGEMIATGVVIGKNTVLTNKHVADNNNANLSFAPAAENENSFPYGTFKAKEVIAYPGDADLVIIHFNKNSEGQSVGDVVTPVTIGESTTVSSNEPITVTGYPGDKPLATMWESSGKVKSNNDNILTYSASTFGGNSGSPVFNDNNELIGLHYGGVEGESNNAVAITGEVLEFIKKHNV
ncbi:serine protease [Staphylococcus cohnii]|nr:serine protease [Staphylococcus cohnii]OAO21775.1 peptidase [Staphylococcus cohnii]